MIVAAAANTLLATRDSNNDDDDDEKDHYCNEILPYIRIPGTHLDLLLLIGVVLYLLMAVITLIFIQYGKYLGSRTNKLFSEAEITTTTTTPTTPNVPSILFPIFEYLLYLQAFISLLTGIIIALIPIHIGTTNQISISLIYSFIFTLQHFLIEGFAILLQQYGCGIHALSLTILYDLIWAIICFIFYFIFFEGNQYSLLGQGLLDFALFLYYGSLTFLPQSILYRRPSLLIYSKYWFSFRLIGTLLHLGFLFSNLKIYSSCGYYFYRILLFCLFQPLLSYQVLLIDSQWWQGLSPNPIYTSSDTENITSTGTPTTPGNEYDFEFSLTSAHTLAQVMDQLNSISNIRFLNYTSITFYSNILLGDGSFSQVIQGKYNNHLIAIKTIYTYDLTTTIIYKIASETKILSLLRNSMNVVGIYGLILLPPSICIVLEYCQYGSLDNILRGYERQIISNKNSYSTTSTPTGVAAAAAAAAGSTTSIHYLPFSLNIHDMLYLALGAARGVHAIHSFSPFLCHRDIKSFNFLVDSKLIVKIADLELGDDMKEHDYSRKRKSCWNIFSSSNGSQNQQQQENTSSNTNSHPLPEYEEGLLATSSMNITHDATSISNDHLDRNPFNIHPSVLEMQATWLAPEVMKTGIFTQSSDIYSLALVLWEIRTKRYPYSHCNYLQTQIRNCVLSGFRESFPLIPSHDIYYKTLQAYDDLIRISWQPDPFNRPKSGEIVTKLEQLVRESARYSLETVRINHINHEIRMSSVRSPTSGRLLGPLDVSIGSDIDEDSQNFFNNTKVEEDVPNHQTSHLSCLTLQNIYHLMESHEGEWIVVSHDISPTVLHLTASFKRLVLNWVPYQLRYEFEKHLQPGNKLLTLLNEFVSACVLITPNSSLLDALTHFLTECIELGYSHLTLSNPSGDQHNHQQQVCALHGYPMDPTTFDQMEDSSYQASPGSSSVIAILFSKLTSNRPVDLGSSRPPSRASFQALNTLFGNILGKSNTVFAQRLSGLEREPLLRESQHSLDSININDPEM